ncbi:MAG: glycosyltransferase [Clostridiaceae bacterium]
MNNSLDLHINELPLVSVLIPTYNQTKYLEFAIESVLNQTYKNLEVIICDDSTNSEVADFIKPYLEKYKFVKYYNNGGPLGLKGLNNVQKCYKLAKGEYISFLLHDDVYDKNKISYMLEYLMNDNEVNLVTSYYEFIDSENKVIRNFKYYEKISEKNFVIDGLKFGKAVIKDSTNYVGSLSSAIFRKSSLENVAFFLDNMYTSLGDTATWLEILRKGKIAYISKPLSFFRLHDNQNTNDIELIFDSVVDLYNMIINSYKNKIFIKTKDELNDSLLNWLEKNIYVIELSKSYNIEDDNLKRMKNKLYEVITSAYKILLNKL